MPTINLRNPFRRDGTRPPLRQRAASLKAAAARAIRGEAPSPGTADPALIALEAEFWAATAAFNEVDTAIGVAYDAYEEPPMPAALRVSRLDWIEHTIPRADTAPAPGGRMRFLPYSRRHVEELRGRRHMMSVPGLGDQRPNPRAQERGDAIVTAWDTWRAEIAAAKQAVGLPALLATRDAAIERRNKVLARIHETPARSLADFVLKARIASAVCQGEPLRPADRELSIEDDDAMPYAITADLLALAGDSMATGA